MREIGNIYLSWRKGQGMRRRIVGTIRRNATSGVSFSYNKDEVAKAKQEGFAPYTEFPEIDKKYTDNVIEIFGQRITKTERSDIKDFYAFWEIDKKYSDDKYYLLAHTQGLLPTDNFEFLANYYPVKELCFMTDLAGVAFLALPAEMLKEGDQLSFSLERNNPHDKYAVKIFFKNQQIGYIKKVHSQVFYKRNGKNLKLIVKAVDQNGIVKRVFVKVSF